MVSSTKLDAVSLTDRQEKQTSQRSCAKLLRLESLESRSGNHHHTEKQLLHIAGVALGAVLISVGSASAGTSSVNAQTSSTSAGGPASVSPQLVDKIESGLAPLLADGVRLRSVALGCEPPADAQLSQIAPGITRLNSRGFVVELRA